MDGSVQRGLACMGMLAILLLFTTDHTYPGLKLPKRVRSTSSIKAPIEMKRARWDYFHRMLRDPATGQIPPGIREKELAFARSLRRAFRRREDALFTWTEVGPMDLGGRTRALAVDVKNSDVIVAGGVSGGIWKSTDRGETWIPKSDPSQNLSVTSLAQDPRPGHTHSWYYATGEFVGNSASDMGHRSPFSGTGLCKSTDDGETWNLIANPWGSDPTVWDSPLDYISRIVISPTTGSIFLASHGIGVYRSTDEGISFDLVLGGINDHYYADVVAGPDGRLVAALSQFGPNSNPTYSPGVYKSTDNGESWTDITPSSFPHSHERSVLALAPSNPDILYVLTFTGDIDHNDRDDVRFHKIDISTGQSEDRSGNLPDFGREGFVHTQHNYNMIVAVKPDDEDHVLVGATSLFRSRDGFAVKPIDLYDSWIGGYRPGNAPHFYPNHHPDQHVIVFDPSDPDKAWIGHDGGVSFVSNIRSSSSPFTFFPWKNKNNGYNVIQFYTITIPEEPFDEQIMGGTQDNGTPFFTWDGTETGPSKDLSSGDGGFSYFGNKYAYTSSHNGRVLRLGYDSFGSPSHLAGWTTVTPEGARNQLFISPFDVDPNDENVMYYAAGNVLWRNDRLDDIPRNEDSTSVGWAELTNLSVPSDYVISAVTVSTSHPKHVLYYGASSLTDPPKLYRLEKSHAAEDGEQDISITDAPARAYLHDIAVNPIDGNEILAVLSNYSIIGLYHSRDGGQTYAAVEGNLRGSPEHPGPSLRSASILPVSEGVIYIIATSTGVYSTMELNGMNTFWTQEGEEKIGNVVAAHVTSRVSDGRVAVGTHGRGVFVGDLDAIPYEGLPSVVSLGHNYPNPFNKTTTIPYELFRPANVEVSIFNIEGHLVETLVDEYQNADLHTAYWNAENVSSGLYVYRIRAGGSFEARKCLLVK